MPEQGSPPRVLLVEDNADDRQLVRELLETEGIEVVGEAPDGAVGVRLAAELEPDVVLMDLRLPGMSGLEATRQIKKILPLTQVITLTASEQLLAWDAAKAGVYAYLDKHRAPGMLKDVVYQARRLKIRLEDQAGAEGASVQTETSPTEGGHSGGSNPPVDPRSTGAGSD